MSIVGFNFEKISIERKKNPGEVKGQIDIKNNTKIKDIVEEDAPNRKKGEILRFSFEFNTLYEPAFGQTTIEGFCLYLDDVKKNKDTLSKWKKDKDLDKELMSKVLNFVLAKCNIKALALSQDVNLPPQIPLPKLTAKKQEAEQYIG